MLSTWKFKYKQPPPLWGRELDGPLLRGPYVEDLMEKYRREAEGDARAKVGRV